MRQLSELEFKVLGYLERGGKSTAQLRAYLPARAADSKADLVELEKALITLRDEGVIAIVNGTWFKRGPAPRWGT